MKKLALAAMLLLATPTFAAESDRAQAEWLRQYFAHITAYCIARGEIPEPSSDPADGRNLTWARRRADLLEQTLKHMIFPASGDPVPLPVCLAPASIALVRCAMRPGPAAGCRAPQMRAVAAQAASLLAEAGSQAETLMRSSSAREWAPTPTRLPPNESLAGRER